MAVDQESGEATFTTVVVDVLSEGQAGKNMVVKTTNNILSKSRLEQIVYNIFLHVPQCWSPLQCAGRRALDKLHRGQSILPLYGDHDGSGMHHVFGNVAKEKAQGQKGPARERLRGSGKTSQRGERSLILSQVHKSWNLQ